MEKAREMVRNLTGHGGTNVSAHGILVRLAGNFMRDLQMGRRKKTEVEHFKLLLVIKRSGLPKACFCSLRNNWSNCTNSLSLRR